MQAFVLAIDIIIPTYNRVEFTKRAIKSVLEQTYQNFHLHIVDDGSDKTQTDFGTHPKMTIHHKTNGGVSSARNLGISKSQSEWIALLDSDDEWLPQKLEKQIEYIQNNPQFRFVHTEEMWIRNGVRVNPKVKHKKSNENIFERSLEFCIISPSTSMIKRDLWNEFGPFNESYPVCEDYDLWNKILSHEEIGFLDMPLTKKYGGHEDQLSTKYVAMDYWRFKSLLALYKDTTIESSKRELIQKMIHTKGEFLKMGYLKHNHQDLYNEIHMALLSL